MRHTSEQNTDVGSSRVSRDWKDATTIFENVREWNLCHYEKDLCNIATGVQAHASVNVDEVEKVGENIMHNMIGVAISQFSFKRKDQAIKPNELCNNPKAIFD